MNNEDPPIDDDDLNSDLGTDISMISILMLMLKFM